MAKEFRYASPAEAKAKAPNDVLEHLGRLGGFATTEAADRYFQKVLALAPVGGRLSKPTKAHAPGLLKSKTRVFSEQAKFSKVYGVSLGGPAKYIIDRGRKKNINAYRVRRRGKLLNAKGAGGSYTVPAGRRMLGSLQAPKGVTRPAWMLLKREEEAIGKVAIAKAEAS